MQASKQKVICYHYSLIELLVVMMVLSLFMILAISFLHRGMDMTKNVSKDVLLSQDVFEIKKAFREMVHQNGMPYMHYNKHMVYENKDYIQFRNNELSFSRQKQERTFKLPSGYDLELSVPQEDMVVMTIVDKQKKHAAKMSGIRLVACTNNAR